MSKFWRTSRSYGERDYGFDPHEVAKLGYRLFRAESTLACMEHAYWEMIADEISRDGWSWGMTQAILNGRKLYVVDAHRGDLLPRHVMKADTLLGAFMELKRELAAGEGRRNCAQS